MGVVLREASILLQTEDVVRPHQHSSATRISSVQQITRTHELEELQLRQETTLSIRVVFSIL